MVNTIHIEELAAQFRSKIETALDRRIIDDPIFRAFPKGCCGDACDLLGQFLMMNDVRTWYVCGSFYPQSEDMKASCYYSQSHAWLTTDDPLSNDNHIIIDITGDQFNGEKAYNCKNLPVYVGFMDEFHSLFAVEERDCYFFKGIKEVGSFAQARLYQLYNKIVN